jgi:hypothetical protein
LRVLLGESLFGRWPFSGVTRPPSPTPATGSHRRHKQEQSEVVARAFGEKIKGVTKASGARGSG